MLYISLVIIQTILFEAHFLVYATMRDIFGLTGSALFVLKIVFAILSISFVSASLLARRFHGRITRILYRGAAVWFGFLIYFLLAAAFYWSIVILGAKDSVAVSIGEILFLLAAGTGIFGLLNANNIRIRRITVEIDHMPPAWKDRKVALLSDIHLGQIRGAGFAKKITTVIQNLSPDIVFFVGDVFDGVKTDAYECVSPFSEIKAPLGSFFVLGNHEEFEEDSKMEYIAALKQVGINVLENRSVTIGGVEIVGVSDSDTTRKKTYATMLERMIGKKKIHPRILLKHTPLSTDVAERLDVDLELSGHTHGGQVFPFNLVTPFIFKKRNYGLSRFGRMAVYTSSGVGTWGPPMRIGTSPEIVLIAFEDKGGSARR